MLLLALGQAIRRRARSLAVILAIVTASVSFALLTSAVATSRLQVQGTVDRNFRGAYDILVRPAGAGSKLERTRHLVQENYLSGIYGGISRSQLKDIQAIPGVRVAAPIAMIGYILPAIALKVPVDLYLTRATDQVYALRQEWTTDRGLSHVPDRETYLYFTRRHRDFNGKIGGTITDPRSGRPIAVCQRFAAHIKPARSAFDLARKVVLACSGSNPIPPGRQFDQFPHGKTGFVVYYQLPMLVAAIDPAEEARLVGLDRAVTAGRYLNPEDHTHVFRSGGRATRELPVLMARSPLTDDTLTVSVHKIEFGSSTALPDRLAGPKAARWLDRLPSATLKTVRFDDRSVYKRLLPAYRSHRPNAKVDYWTPGPATYSTTRPGHLEPRVVPPGPPETFENYYFGGFYAPQVSGDKGFRSLSPPHESSTMLSGGVPLSPNLHAVGVFDPDRIEGFSALSKVPLTTYYPPDARPADARSRKLLKGRPLLPNANLAGYLQQPPMVLTTMRSLGTFLDQQVFPGVDPKTAAAPISVVRVRVAGVTGADDVSRERVRLVAEQILRRTGLTVDITVGSSPTPEDIELPAGKFGRPRLTLSEGWVQKGVGVRLLSSIDRKSLLMFGLVLLVCLLFLINATVAAVRTRRAELGVLACVGWKSRSIFALIEAELLVTGAVAGVAGTAIAAGIVAGFGLHAAWWHLLLITPTATLLAGLAGVWPAWRASFATPIEALRPPTKAPRRAADVNSIAKLALVGVRRVPGRTVLGAASLFVGVAAFALLLAVQQAFRGGVVGTVLGDAVALQVRSVDYLAAAITIALGAFAVADIAYLNISERAAEIGTLRSTGWAERHLRRLFGIEALVVAALGAVGGGMTGLLVAVLVLPVAVHAVVLPVALAVVGGVAASMLAVAAPLSRLSQLAPSAAIVSD